MVTRTYLLATCGEYHEPEPCCSEEANPPMAWCERVEDWVYFDAEYRYGPTGPYLVVGATATGTGA